MPKQVMCITKRGDHYNPHERIQRIGGVDASGNRWSREEDDAIKDVEKDPRSYYVSVGTHTVWVVVAQHKGRKYLKTEPDNYAPDNLLSLRECP